MGACIFKASKLQSSPSSDYFFCLLRIFAFVTDLCLHLVLFCSHKPFSYVPSFHIYKKDKNGCFILDFFGSDLSKMDQS